MLKLDTMIRKNNNSHNKLLTVLVYSISNTINIFKDYLTVCKWTLSPKNKIVIVQELCESRGGRPGLSILTSLLASVDIKIYWTMLTLVPNMSTDIRGH